MASAEVAALNEIDKTASFDVNATADLDDMEFNEMLGGQIPATDGFLMSSWFEVISSCVCIYFLFPFLS